MPANAVAQSPLCDLCMQEILINKNTHQNSLYKIMKCRIRNASKKGNYILTSPHFHGRTISDLRHAFKESQVVALQITTCNTSSPYN
jgi:hypothetical protein